MDSPVHIDPELLTPPDPGPTRPRRLIWLLVGALTLGGVLWWSPWSGSQQTDREADDTAPIATPAAESSPGSTPVPTLHLEAVTHDQEFLLYPTLLPSGFEHCWVADDFRETDRFCDPASEDRWLNVSLDHQIQLGSGTYVANFHSAEWVEVGRRLLIPIGFATLVVTASGLTADEVLNISESIPVVGNREWLYSAPEEPLDVDALTDEQVSALVDAAEPSGLSRYDGSFRLTTAIGSLNANPSFDPLYEFTSTMPQPRRVVLEGRPIIVGESADGRWYATWIQRGLVLQLEGEGIADDAERLAVLVIDALADLP